MMASRNRSRCRSQSRHPVSKHAALVHPVSRVTAAGSENSSRLERSRWRGGRVSAG
jgi:hypothetical protein